MFLGLCVGSLVLIILWSSQAYFRTALINADSITAKVFLNDLVGGNSISEWSLPPAPSLFSEVGLYWLSGLLTQDFYKQVPIVTCLQAILIFLGMLISGKAVFGQGNRVSCIIAFFIVFMGLRGAIGANSYWLFTFWNNMHTGALVLSLMSLSLTFLSLRRKVRFISSLILLLALSFLSAFESKIHFLSFIIPMSISLLALKLTDRSQGKRIVALLGTINIGFLLGLGILKVIFPKDPLDWYPKHTAEGFINSTYIFRDTLWALLDRSFFGDWCFILLCMVGIDQSIKKIIFGLRSFKSGGPSNFEDYMPEFLLVLSSGISISATIWLGRFNLVLLDLRYFMFPIIIGILIGVRELIQFFTEMNFKKRIQTYFPYCLCVVFLAALIPERSGNFNKSNLDILSECITTKNKEYSLKHGVASYWISKPLNFFSNATLKTVQFGPDWKPFYWMNNKRSFYGSSQANLDDIYFNYVVLDGWLKQEDVNKLVGNTGTIFTCNVGPINNGFHVYAENKVNVLYFSNDVFDKFIKSRIRDYL